MQKKIVVQLILCFVALLLMSCGPVNFLTLAKRTPRLYSDNYDIANIKAPKTEVNKQAWIVYSDKANNPCFVNAGGKVVFKQAEFLQPFYVIGKKGSYLKLVKYAPGILKFGWLFDTKKAEYYAWMDKSQLLLTSTSVSDVRTGFKNRTLTAIKDTLPIFYATKYFEKDSVQLFDDPTLSKSSAKSGLYELVYRYKKSDDGKTWLIGKTYNIETEKAKTQLLGWIDDVMLQDVGQRTWIKWNKTDTSLPKVLQLSPAINPYCIDSSIKFQTISLNPIIDPSENTIYNVNGNPISYANRKVLEKDLKRINITFSIDAGEHINEQLPSIINGIQNMLPFFQDTDDFEYQFTIACYKGEGKIMSASFSTLNDVVDWLIVNGQLKDSLSYKISKPWLALKQGIEILGQDTKATNLFINIGESINGIETAENSLINRLSKINGRLLSFQIYNGDNNNYNNYVLQSSSMIEGYADIQTKVKRNFLVFANQIRNDNQFSENNKTTYMLDFPNKSITQGMVIFPEKKEFLSADILVKAVDTMMKEIKADNLNLIHSFDKAFATVGNGKDKYDSMLVEKFQVFSRRKIDKDYRKTFKDNRAIWLSSTSRFSISNEDTAKHPVYLLMSEKEVDQLKIFLKEVSAKEVEIEGDTKIGYTQKRTLCEVRKTLPPLDGTSDSIQVVVIDTIITTEIKPIVYAFTRNVRRHLYRWYKNNNPGCYDCLDERGGIRWATLSQSQANYTSLPAIDTLLQKLRIKDLKRRKKLTDAQLDKMIQFFKQKKHDLDEQLVPKNEIMSSGEKYYKINRNALP